MKTLLLAICCTLLAVAAQAKLDCRPRSGISPETERGGVCGFDSWSRSFKGSPAEQARCLTRAVKPGGTLGAPTLPASLEHRAGKPAPSPSVIAALLEREGVPSDSVGGALRRPVTANYFIIYDTSSPNCSARGVSRQLCPKLGQFPSNRDDASWPENMSFGGHPRAAPNRLAHVFVNRLGESVTEVDLAETLPTTKFEQCRDATRKLGLFVGVENIQPRIGAPAIVPVDKNPNDRIGPTPGFTLPQYDRLALIYVVASARRGHWLIPAFHAVIDQDFRDGHDDPQNFDIEFFAEAVEHYAASIGETQ